MGKIRLAVAGETLYAERLTECIRKNAPEYLEVLGCQCFGELPDFLARMQPDILLCEQELAVEDRLTKYMVCIQLTDELHAKQEENPDTNGRTAGQGSGFMQSKSPGQGRTGENKNPGQNGRSGENENPGQNGGSGENENPGQNGGSRENENLGQNGRSGENENPCQNGRSGENENPCQNGRSGENEYPDQSGRSGENEYPDQSGRSGENEYPDQSGRSGENEYPDQSGRSWGNKNPCQTNGVTQKKGSGQAAGMTQRESRTRIREYSGYSMPVIFRYQRGSEILRQIFQIYEKHSKKNLVCQCKTSDLEMTAFYAPGGHELLLPFSISYASLCGTEAKALYMNLSEFSGMRPLFGEKAENTLSDLIYGIRQRKDRFLFCLQSVLHHADRFDYILPPENPEDLYEIQEEDLACLLKLLSEQTEYKQVIWSCGTFNQTVEQVMECCGRVFCVVKENAFGKYRKVEFDGFLKKELRQRLREKVQYISPQTGSGGFVQGVDIMAQLQGGEFAEQVRKLTQNGMQEEGR